MNTNNENYQNDVYVNRFEEMNDVADYVIGLCKIMLRTYSLPTEREFFDFAYRGMIMAQEDGRVQNRDRQYLLEMFEESNRDKPNYEVAVKFTEHVLESVETKEVLNNMSRFVQQLRSKRKTSE
ncbi:MAG: hypothetical protein WAV41_00225 [Microgenomates group bacterium]